MFISRLNKILKKYSKISFILLTLLIAVPFVFYFSDIQGSILSLIFSKNNENTLILDDITIKSKEIQSNIDKIIIWDLKTQPEIMDKIKDKNLRQKLYFHAINSILLMKRAEKELDIYDVRNKISVKDKINNESIFQTEGKFDKYKYESFIENLKKYKIKEKKFLNFIQDELIIEELYKQVTIQIQNITDREVEKYYDMINSNYHIKLYICDPKKYVKKLKIDKNNLIEFFNENKDKYQFNKKSKAIFVIFDKNNNKKLRNNNKQIKLEKSVEMNAKIFATEAYKKLFTGDITQDKLLQQNNFENYAKQNTKNVIHINNWINEKTRFIEKLGYYPEISSILSKLTPEYPLSDAINLDNNKYCVIYLTERKINDEENDINEVIEEVTEDYKLQLSEETMIKKISKNDFSNCKSYNLNFTLKDINDKKEDIYYKKYKNIILPNITDLMQNSYSEIIKFNDELIIIYLKKIVPPNKSKFTKNIEQIREKYKNNLKANIWEKYKQDIAKRYSIFDKIYYNE